jgi:hypothetical protein
MDACYNGTGLRRGRALNGARSVTVADNSFPVLLALVLLYCFKKIEVSHKFLTMDDEKLIECVRKYPAIYDMSHSKYSDSNYESSLWMKISEEMKEEGK